MEQDAFYQVGEFDRSKVDLDKPAMTVDEYMQQVVVGRERVPEVAVASAEVFKRVSSVSSSKTSVTNPSFCATESPITSRFGPDKEWSIAKSNAFSLARSTIEAVKAPRHLLKDIKMPAVGDSMRWNQVCFESRLEGVPISPEQEQRFAHHKGTPPTTGLVKSLNDNQVNELILHQIDYMLEKGYTRASLEWLFALLLVVKKPLLQEVVSSLRAFCRKCKEWRAELDEDEEDTIYQLSWFVAVITIYFVQRDLADHR